MAKSDAPLKDRSGTKNAPMSKDKGPPSVKKKHPLAPLPTKDPKKKTPGVGNIGRM